jgi:hypothetical protein
MDGKPVMIHGSHMGMLHPKIHIGFWGWAYRCFTQMAMVTADFFSRQTDSLQHGTYYPSVIIWSGFASTTRAFSLLRSYKEKELDTPLFCLCSLGKETFSDCRENGNQPQMTRHPFLMQFIDEFHESLILRYFEETIDRLDKGICIRPRKTDSVDLDNIEFDHDNVEFMFHNSSMSVTTYNNAAYFSPEITPIIDIWQSFFSTIQNEIGVLPRSSPVISFNMSSTELYKKIIDKY